LKTLKTFIITIVAIIAVADLFGFVLVYFQAPNLALARFFVDVGVIVALIYVCMAALKPISLPTDEIAQAIRELAQGKYNRRLGQEYEQLNDIAQAFNELAGSLADQRSISLAPALVQAQEKQKNMTIAHSYHPELGTVEKAAYELKKDDNLIALPSVVPFAHEEPKKNIEPVTPLESKEIRPIEPVQNHKSPLEELFENYQTAMYANQQKPLTYDAFCETLESVRAQLMNTHQCKDVLFELVVRDNHVALQPKIIRK